MKRITLLVATIISIIFTSLVLISINSSAEEKSITFKMEMKPNKTYKSHIKMSSTSETDFIADQEILDKFLGPNAVLPMLMKNEQEISSELITQNYDNNGEIPLTMTYDKAISKALLNGKETINELPISGMRAHGKFDKESKLVIDSIAGGNLSPQMESFVISSLENAQQAMKFPEKPIKIGDSFNIEVPMTIPIEGMNPVTTNIDMEYKLTQIKEEIAFFDIDGTFELEMNQEPVHMTTEGTGRGTAEFDLNERFLTNYLVDMSSTTIISDGEMTMKLKSKSTSEQNMEIE